MAIQEADNINKTNLIINYLPQVLSDEEFYSLFAAIGPVYSARIIRERSTGYSYGYGFVKYQQAEHASAAIDQLNGLQILNKTIKVAYSLPAGQDNKNINVYVKGLPAGSTNDTLKKLFEPYGEIVECRAIPDKITGLCQGIGFVLFSKKEEAEVAIDGLNGTKVEGGTEPLIVKYARKDNRKPNAQQSPQGDYSTYNTYGWNNGGPMMGGGMRPQMPTSPAMMQGGGPMRGMVGGRGRNMNRFSPMTGPRFGFNPQNQGGGSSNFTGGFIVFIYGIGPHSDENTMWQMCSPYGEIKRVNVIRDHQKNQGKGYGFVTFGTLQEATYCISQLNGSPFEGKQLQVSLKSSKMS